MRHIATPASKGLSIVMRGLALAGLLGTVGGYAHAQAADWPRPMERSEPHEALTFFEGTWTVPGDKGWRETCSWLAKGRRHMVCKPRWQSGGKVLEGLGVYSYDEKSGEYLAHGFKPPGRVSAERGQRIPSGFRFMSESGTGADRLRNRHTLEEGSAGRVTGTSETAKGDGPWVVEDKTEYLRTRP
jgi:hypothetical protein